LKRDWAGVLKKIHNFLGVESQMETKRVVRNTGGVPNRKMFNFLVDRKIINIGKAIIPNKLHNLVDQKIKSLAFKRHIITEKQHEYLFEQFTPDIISLDELINSNFKRDWLESIDC
jgi:hypothetical protein